MLCSRFKQILFTKTTLNNNVQFHCFINVRFLSKQCRVDGFWATLTKHRKELSRMSSFRFIFRDIRVTRFWSVWSRGVNIGHVVKRCRRDKSVREVLQCFRQAFMRPRRTLIFSATAAFKARGDDEDEGAKPPSCAQGITDEELEALLSELDNVDDLSKRTLFCTNCSQRMVIDKKLPGVTYCPCKEPRPPPKSPDGWEPYMEAQDVIIWRKEYKHGQGLYAYKVYGRYKDVVAQDFAAVNVDGGYRRVWDSAVAALSVVERAANGVPDQAVLHWEVLWPRLFANRDYVYIRRHKEYAVRSAHSPHVFEDPVHIPAFVDRPSVHSNAKRKSLEAYSSEECDEDETDGVADETHETDETDFVEISPTDGCDETDCEEVSADDDDKGYTLTDEEISDDEEDEVEVVDGLRRLPKLEKDNKVYVVVSRSCTHPAVPEGRNAIRVSEYWSNLLVKTIDGPDEVGMEFVLTYYDEPAVGGLPSGVAAWATGRAAPAYLHRMRAAAKDYQAYRSSHPQEIPDFAPFGPSTKPISERKARETPQAEMTVVERETTLERLNEEDMESCQTGPDMESEHTRDQSTQTEEPPPRRRAPSADKAVDTGLYPRDVNVESSKEAEPTECEKNTEEDSSDKPSGWWRYLYPFYYFG